MKVVLNLTDWELKDLGDFSQDDLENIIWDFIEETLDPMERVDITVDIRVVEEAP